MDWKIAGKSENKKTGAEASRPCPHRLPSRRQGLVQLLDVWPSALSQVRLSSSVQGFSRSPDDVASFDALCQSRLVHRRRGLLDLLSQENYICPNDNIKNIECKRVDEKVDGRYR